ncbi:hypothetical protein D1610_00910 [Sphingomonas gilva]|uniref:Uncharacterized protein n=1 Tax=Sphingomonas gilva TaxID=2305907 RepID=A0A396RY46_9SPHN|nr:hypothetical protein D1610_00910 [Sphingomonas gilva]
MMALIALAALTACVERIAESRVRAALVDAGLSTRNADCMARRMVDRLTIAQLRRLEQLSAARRERLTLAEYVDLVRRVGDAEAIAVTTSSAALCATGFG